MIKHRYHLGYHQPGTAVRLACDDPTYPDALVEIVRNSSSTTGVVTVRHKATGAISELDGFRALHHAWPTASWYSNRKTP